MEIERKFLVLKVPENLKKSKGATIFQGYLAIEMGGNEVRIKNKGNRNFIIVKSDGKLDGDEVEIAITKREFDRLLPLCHKRTVEKTSYKISFDKQTIELAVFQGKHKGLVLARVGFKNKKESFSFKKPSWFGREVTVLQGYKNRSLAVEGLPF